MIWRIAVRNLIQHRTKTLIIGSLIAICIMLTFFGNSLIASMRKGISSSFTDMFTGDVLITSSEGLGAGVFGAQSSDLYSPPVIPVLKDFDRALDTVTNIPEMESWTTQMSVYVLYNYEEKGMDYSLLFGIDPDDYWKTMDNVKMLEGRRLVNGEEGIMLNVIQRDRALKDFGVALKVGDPIQLNSFGDAGIKIREVPIVGVFEFKSANKRFFAPGFADIRTIRVLSGRFSGPVEKVEVSEDSVELLSMDPDDLFGEEADIAGPGASETAPARTDEESLLRILGEKSARPAQTATADGSWHFIIVRLKNGADPDSVIKRLNLLFASEGIAARAQGWQPSGAPDSYTFWFVGIIFQVAMWLLAIVSIFIIMNTLVISVMERTSEIGTMRALGAQKGLVMEMFVYETLFITAVFGLIGIFLGMIVTAGVAQAGIPADNDFLSVIYGGSTLRPMITGESFGQVIAIIIVISLIAWIYPVYLALKVSPLKAISTE